MTVSPEMFLDKYMKILHEKSLESLKADKDVCLEYRKMASANYTEFITLVAAKAISNFSANKHFEVAYKGGIRGEIFKIDVVGCIPQPDNTSLVKQIKIAYEHESDRNWNEEMHKLCHVISELKVIASYHNFKNGRDKIKDSLTEKLNSLGKERIYGDPNCEWLFIFGPRKHYNQCYRAFTLDKDAILNGNVINKDAIREPYIDKIAPISWYNDGKSKDMEWEQAVYAYA